jgi:hypothetical protein
MCGIIAEEAKRAGMSANTIDPAGPVVGHEGALLLRFVEEAVIVTVPGTRPSAACARIPVGIGHESAVDENKSAT